MSTDEDRFDYQAWAWKILGAAWAKPREIAQAWVVAQTGATEAGDHWRFVAIANAHEWIKSLGLPASDGSGMPSRARPGPIPCDEQGRPDIEAHALVRVSEVRSRAEAEGRPWPRPAPATWSEWSADQKRDNAQKLVLQHGSQAAAARAVGINPETLRQYLPGNRMNKSAGESRKPASASNWPSVPAKPRKY